VSQVMLRSIEVVKSCSRDHVILVITSSRLADRTHFNADRQFRQTWRHIVVYVYVECANENHTL